MLAAGTTLGPYKIIASLGAGGMGEVYRAHDARLGRDVALKVIPAELARDPERHKRFEQEARAAGALDHPNVCAVHDIGTHAGAPFVVMELLEGESLRQRLAVGPIPARKAVDYVAQAAYGLAAAHEKGIVHRDLKPENLFVTRDGRVKVLDFGLAKLTRPEILAASGEAPVSTAGTETGAILGTVGYMAPEQILGRAADGRSDLFALGAILYELLTGKRAFQGATYLATLNAILTTEPPPLAAGGREIPPGLDPIVRRCLEKSPEERFQSARDLAFGLEALKEARAGRAPTGTGVRASARWRWAIGALVLLVAVAAGVMLGPNLPGFGQAPRSGVKRLSITIPRTLRALSYGFIPGGSGISVWAVPREAERGGGGLWRIYIRRFDSYEFKPLRGSEGVSDFAVSPDGRWCAMVVPVAPGTVARRLVRLSLEGDEPPVSIRDWPEALGGTTGSLSWLPDGNLVISTSDDRHYFCIPIDGGPPEVRAIPTPDTSRLMFWSNDGAAKGLGRLVSLTSASWRAGVFRYDAHFLDMKTDRITKVVTDAGEPALLDRGPLVFTRGDKLFAARFDKRRIKITGPTVALLDGLRTSAVWSHARFDMLPDGTLLYAPGSVAGTRRRLAIIGPSGPAEPCSLQPAAFSGGVRLAPDGHRVAAVVPTVRGLNEIWLFDLRSQIPDHKIAAPAADCNGTVWSPDGRWVAYEHQGRAAADGIYVAPADGSGPAKRVLASDRAWPVGWDSRSGVLIYSAPGADGTYDAFALPLGPAADSVGPPRPLLAGPAQVYEVTPSPDGSLLAYVSDESGHSEVYLARLGPGPTVGTPVKIAAVYSNSPQWSRDGRRLYFSTLSPAQVVFVEVTTTPRLAVSEPRQVLDRDATHTIGEYAVLPDGRLLTLLKGEEEDDIRELAVVFGFGDEIRQKLRRAR